MPFDTYAKQACVRSVRLKNGQIKIKAYLILYPVGNDTRHRKHNRMAMMSWVIFAPAVFLLIIQKPRVKVNTVIH